MQFISKNNTNQPNLMSGHRSQACAYCDATNSATEAGLHIGLRFVPISVMILSDCNVLLYSISLVFYGARCVKVNENRHILSAAIRYLIAADSTCPSICSSMLLGL